MKTAIVTLLITSMLTAFTSAQIPAPVAVDPQAAAAAGLLPQAWQGHAMLFLMLLPLFGRAWHALVNNGGLRGVWNAVIFGTNTPKPKD